MPGPAGESRRVSRYRLLQRVGEGGMGEVWRAEQVEPVQRDVALKLIKPGLDSAEVLARFESERQALALMDHSSIAKVYDAGTTENGRPFFAMEYVQGVPISDYCDARRLSVEQRLEIFLSVCAGIQHAHQKAIIHRDVKPSNVLVAEENGRPIVKIIDFGVAKARARRLTEKTLYTELGQAIGTPEYMSPEQADPTNDDIDIRTDVYSLGLVLYELLVGVLPFDAKERRAAGFAELQRRIREEAPPKPSTRLNRLGDRSTASGQLRGVSARDLGLTLRGDLDWIAMKALATERSRRYETVNALARDIERYLKRQPIEARPPSVAYRTAKFVWRPPVGPPLAAVVALWLVGSAVAVYVAAERGRAERQAARATAVVDFLTETLTSADPNQGLGREVTVLEALAAASDEVESAFTADPDIQAAVQSALGSTYFQLGRIDEAEPFLRRALATRLDLHGSASLEAAESHFRLGMLLAEKGDYDGAESELGRSIEIRAQELGPEDPSVGDVLSMLGTVQRWRGEYATARASFERALAISRAAHEAPHGAIIGNLNGLGIVERRLGELEAAEARYREALAMGRRLYGDEHMEVATTLNNLGVLLDTKGEHRAAIEVYSEALEIRRSVLGEGHFYVANSLQNLAVSYESLGDFETAEVHSRRALEKNIAAFESPHARIAQSQRNLGVLLGRMARLDEAATHLRAALEMRRVLFGEEHDDVANSKLTVASVERQLGNFEEAEALARQALATYEASLGNEHRWVGICLTELGKILEESGSCDAAMPRYTQALEILGATGTERWVAQARAGLGHCLVASERWGDAEDHLVAALEVLEGDVRAREVRRRAIEDLALLYAATDRHDQAARYRRMALATAPR